MHWLDLIQEPPLAAAASAFLKLATAKSSWSWRVNPHFSAHRSPHIPMWMLPYTSTAHPLRPHPPAPVAEPVTAARLFQQVRPSRHVFRPSCHHHRRIPALDRLGSQHHRFQTGAADLVDRCRPDIGRSPAPMLTCRATFCPSPAPMTLPKMTSSTSPGLSPARPSAALTTRCPAPAPACFRTRRKNSLSPCASLPPDTHL